jgi:metallo-beta-lactamase class B
MDRRLNGAAIGLAAALLCGAAAMAFDYGKEAFERHTAKALTGIPEAVQPRIREFCTGPADPYTNAPGKPYRGSTEPSDPAKNRVEPTRVFDDLYFVGDRNVSVWALTTSAGIVLFDSEHADLVEDRVINGLVKLGLDPSTIRYVVVTHGHDDHYGGARLLQERYGARVIMGAADWKVRTDQNLRGFREPLPKPDISTTGRTLVVGDTRIDLVATPGHTPGTLSAIFPVHDGSERHVVGLWGGGFPHESVSAMKQFALSAEKWARLNAKSGVDVVVSNHPKNDESLGKMQALAKRVAGQPHPFVSGPGAVAQRNTVLSECARAYVALKGPKG